jgi:dihydropyrimidinase
MRVDYNPYEGFELQGQIVQVVSHGELVVDCGRWLGSPGRGRFLPRRSPSVP